MPDATIAIVSRNRREELRRALASASSQRGSIEILVVDDASSDATAEMVTHEFPDVRFVRFESRAGLVVRRNDAARLATSPVIVSIDDDAVFSTDRCVEQTLEDFDDPIIGAIAIPYEEAVDGQTHRRQLQPSTEYMWIAPTFRGTAYAVRRDVFLGLRGFRAAIAHEGEENDFCLRLLAAGYVVRLGRADRICHYPSSSRDIDRMDIYGRRNEQLWAFTYFPFPLAPALMLGYMTKGLVHGLRVGRPCAMIRGIAAGALVCWRLRHERQPVPWSVAILDRRIRRARALRLDDVRSRLPSPSPAVSARQ